MATPLASIPQASEVTYTIKVLSKEAGGAPASGLRTVLFQRISEGEAIEISAETDAENLLEKLPEFIEVALAVQRSIAGIPHHDETGLPGVSPVLPEESRRLRFLTGDHDAKEGEPKARGALRLIGAAYLLGARAARPTEPTPAALRGCPSR